MKVILIVGNTYMLRRQIKQMGGKWCRDNYGWVVPQESSEKATGFCYQNNLDHEVIDVDDNPFRELSQDELRDYRTQKVRRKADKYLEWAKIAERKSKELHNGWKSRYKGFDWTEPIKIGHHSERRHRKVFEARDNMMDKICELDKKAKMYREKAEHLLSFKGVVKGDAEKERQEKRDKFDKKIGDRVDTVVFGMGEIIKINKKTVKVKTERGTHLVDKSWL